MIIERIKQSPKSLIYVLISATVISAAVMTGVNYIIQGPLMSAAGGNSSSASYQAKATVGQATSGKAESASYKSDGGSMPQVDAVISAPPASNLQEVFVYPNPFKPGTGGLFDSDKITFSRLTETATIKIYTYTGALVATLEKTDTSVDYYEWDVTNESGDKIASGIYIYYIKSPGGEKAKGKFGIIR
ncbi:MAG: T9SS type A sorting domain-containing protein [Endomicrobiales bacterium]|nr:T9SS type A sorting domain-containing protein [Endomicrobiales bacterium]